MKDLAAGTVLDGRFVIRRRLGSGAFGTVYLADQQVFDLTLRQVALKLFHSDLVTEANAAEQLNDAAVLMRLQEEKDDPEAGKHLITVLDAGFLGREAFVAMEYAAGYELPGGRTAYTLRDMIDAFRPVPVDLALRWMVQVLRAVGWMHTLDPPVLRCDLKTDNILADGPNTLKVADFGLAQLTFGIVGLKGGAGALTCQSPETLAGVSPTPASDVYSLGLMLHEILTGRNPLADVGVLESATNDTEGLRQRQLEARQAGLPPLTEADNDDLVDHPLVSEIVGRCLRLRAPERYANAAMMLRDIETYLSQGRITAAGPGVRVPDEAPVLGRLLSEANALHRQGRADEARARAKAALAEHPESVAPYLALARLSLTADGWPEALKLCAAALNLPGTTPADTAELLDVTADAYDSGGKPSLAAKMRERAAAARKGGHR